MTDIFDRAQERQLAELEALQAKRLKQATTPDLRGDIVFCLGCGERIDPRRLQAAPHCTRCVQCELQSEHRHR